MASTAASKRILLPYLAVIAAGLGIRLLMLLFLVPSQDGDGAYYLHVAQSGPDLFRPPLYALFLAPFADVPWLAFVAQSALTIGAACLCLRMTGSFWAALLIVLCPFFIVYDFRILSEALLFALLLTGWLLLEKGKAAWSGFCIGLAILTNDVFLLLPLFAIPFGLWLGKGRNFAVMAVVAYLVALPWAAYNLAANDRFALSEGRMGFNLWVGSWERDGRWVDNGIRADALPDYAFRSDDERRVLLEALRTRDDATFQRAAVDRITSDIPATAVTWAKRYWRLWVGTRTDHAQLRLETGSPAWLAFKSAAWGINLILLFAGFAALVMTRNWLWAVPVLYVALIYVPFHNTETRYSLAAYPFLLCVVGRWLSAKQAVARAGVKVVD